jgi:hypothetical protein
MAGKRTTREGEICTQSSERKTGEGDQDGGAGRISLIATVAGALGVSVRFCSNQRSFSSLLLLLHGKDYHWASE